MRTYNLLILGLSALLLSACTTMQHGKQWVELPEGLYHGSVKNELPNGNGILKHKNGSIYRGHFKNGYMHGKGVFEWKSGSLYSGQYHEGKRHGKGTYSWPNEPSTKVTIKPEFVREKASLISLMANATRDISSPGNDKAKAHYTIQPGRWTGDFGRMTSW